MEEDKLKQELSPLLTGDVLFQQRIHLALLDYGTPIDKISNISVRLSALEMLDLNLSCLLSKDDQEEVTELVKYAQEQYSKIKHYHTPNYPLNGLAKESLHKMLTASQEAVKILYKVAFENGHIIKLKTEVKNVRR